MAISSFRGRSQASAGSSATSSEQTPLTVVKTNKWYKKDIDVTAGNYRLEKRSGFGFSIFFANGQDAISYQHLSADDTEVDLSVPSDADRVWYKGSARKASLTFQRIGDASPVQEETVPETVSTITSSGSVTFNNSVVVLALGGGGNGGNTNTGPNGNSYGNAFSAGGGSGYLEYGVLSAGTYNAVIGGPGSPTEIGNIIAAPGENGQGAGRTSGTVYGGAGGSGGSGGNSVSNSGNWQNRGSSGGINGGDGNATNDVGNGSGVSLISGFGVGTFSPNVVAYGNSSTNSGAGIYAGGASGNPIDTASSYSRNGANANGYGGGGGGSASRRSTSSGGSGAAGVIWYKEVG